MIIGAMLVRNEAGRYLERVLEQMQKVCDKIVIVDDVSTDNTVDICRGYGAEVHGYGGVSWFDKDELGLRKALWCRATDIAKHGDWIICLDADETLAHPERLPEVIKLVEQHGADSIAFRLFDMWNETHYRDDEHWTAHRRFWPMCIRYDAAKEYHWNEQPLHCGRFPVNAAERMIDAKIDIQHWGWSREADRREKYERYKRIDVHGLGDESQYESILDPVPNLRRYGAKHVLIGGPVRQDKTTFKLYLDSLARLDTAGIEVDWAFILHNCPELEPLIRERNPHAAIEHLTDDGEYRRKDTHIWERHNFSAVVRMRNALLQAGRHYDYLFMVDSDLILHPQTLQQLVKADKPIVSNVFWTKWDKDPDAIEMPNAWMYDQYHFDRKERMEKWREPGIYQVGMTGACTLIRNDVIKAGVTYSPIPNVSFSNWEDRAFCIRAACAGFDIWMDTTYPAKHLYRDEDVQEVLSDGKR